MIGTKIKNRDRSHKKSTRNFRDKLQFVNLTKRLMFDLTKILLSKSLISTAVESNYLNIFSAAK